MQAFFRSCVRIGNVADDGYVGRRLHRRNVMSHMFCPKFGTKQQRARAIN